MRSLAVGLLVLFGVEGVFAVSAAETSVLPTGLADHRYERNGVCEVRYEVPGDFAITGLGLRAADGGISTCHITIREIRPDGTLGASHTLARGSQPRHYPEGSVHLPDGYVAVGFGVRVDPVWDIGVVSLWGARFHRDGTLGDPIEMRAGFRPTEPTEQQVLLRGDRLLTGIGIGTRDHDAVAIMAQSASASRYRDSAPIVANGSVRLSDYALEPSSLIERAWFAPANRVITGVAMRAREQSVATMIIRTHRVMPDGSLNEEETAMVGWFSNREPEGREAFLPEGYVATGIGLTIRPVADVQDLALWGARLLPDGSLVDPMVVHGGFGPDVEGAQQQEIHLPQGRVLVGLGFRIDNDRALGILAESARIEKVPGVRAQ